MRFSKDADFESMEQRNTKIPTLPNTGRVGHPKNRNQSLGVDVLEGYRPTVRVHPRKNAKRWATRPEFDQRIRAPSNSMGVVALYFRLLHDATSWPWAIATIAIIAAAIIKFRSSRLIWILPLALGTIVGNVLARALR